MSSIQSQLSCRRLSGFLSLMAVCVLVFASSATAAQSCSQRRQTVLDKKAKLLSVVDAILIKRPAKTRQVMKRVEDIEGDLSNSLAKAVRTARLRLSKERLNFKVDENRLNAHLAALGITDFESRLSAQASISRQTMLDELQSLEAAAYQNGYRLCSGMPLCAEDASQVRESTRDNAFFLRALLSAAPGDPSLENFRSEMNAAAAILEEIAARNIGTVLICSLDARCAADSAVRDALIRSIDILNAVEGKTAGIENLSCETLAVAYGSELGLSAVNAYRISTYCKARSEERLDVARAQELLELALAAQSNLSPLKASAREAALAAQNVKPALRVSSGRTELTRLLGVYTKRRAALIEARAKYSSCRK
jgi:hypothetical protein